MIIKILQGIKMSKLLDIDVNQQLIEVLGEYDVKLEPMEEYLFSNGMFPGITARAFEMEDFGESVVVQLDISMLFPNGGFVESFVAQGITHEEALSSAFQQFEVNVLHAFITAFWEDGKRVENGVGTDIWEINGSKWQVVVSNFGYRGVEEFDNIIDDIDTLFDIIENNIKSLPLTEEIYAVRTVYTNTSDGKKVSEAYINNEPFVELEEAVSKLGWRESDSFYSVRNLVLLMRLQD